MYRRYLPLEDWEWNAIRRPSQSLSPVVHKRLPGLLRAERLVRRSEFARRNGLIGPLSSHTTRLILPTPPSRSRLEHRLYALFAE